MFVKLIPIFVLAFMFQAHGFEKGEKHEDFRAKRFERMIERLNISDDQLLKLNEHREKNKANMGNLRKTKRELREKIKQAFIEGADDKTIKELHLKLKIHREKMFEFRLSKMLVLKSILTKEQQEQFIEMKSKFRKRRHRRGVDAI